MKSSHPDRSFEGFVRSALAALAAEVPWAYDGIVCALGSTSTTVVVDGEPATVRAGGNGVVVMAGADADADTRCVTTTLEILDLVAGREALIDAIETDRVHLTGSVDALLRWCDTLEQFLHGAVRARAFDGLLVDFRARARALEE